MELSTNMEIDSSNEGSEHKTVEGGKPITPTNFNTAAAEPIHPSPKITGPSPLVSVSVEETPSVEKADTLKPSIQNDNGGIPTTLADSTPTTTDNSDGATTAVLSLYEAYEASKSFVTSISTSSKEDKPNESEKAPNETRAKEITTLNSTKTTIKSKHTSPMGPPASTSETKVYPAGIPNVEKTSTDTLATQNTSGGTEIALKTNSLKKEPRKKRKTTGLDDVKEKGGIFPKKKKLKSKKEKEDTEKISDKVEKSKKARKLIKKASGSSGNSSSIPYTNNPRVLPGLSAAQIAVQDQMRKALEEDLYSANGSIVDTDSDDDERQYIYKGQSIRLDRAYLLQAAKRCAWLEGVTNTMLVNVSTPKVSTTSIDCDMDDKDAGEEEDILNEDGSTKSNRNSNKKKSLKSKKKGRNQYTNRNQDNNGKDKNNAKGSFRISDKPKNASLEIDKQKNLGGSASPVKGMEMERDQGSIFGQTTGSSNSTWVECDKCKKWRRLRGVVDHSKLPKKWYCSMNRNDPERARCSAPEEEYDAPHTAESAADARTRRHLRVWVRRLQCNEQYESRLPPLTRGKKRSVASSSKEPNEWVRCCNPSCGKWRAILKIMDAKQNVIDRTTDGEWYCVMNTWDEKTASCAAPQENLPALGCPSWVLQDEN